QRNSEAGRRRAGSCPDRLIALLPAGGINHGGHVVVWARFGGGVDGLCRSLATRNIGSALVSFHRSLEKWIFVHGNSPALQRHIRRVQAGERAVIIVQFSLAIDVGEAIKQTAGPIVIWKRVAAVAFYYLGLICLVG